MDETTGENPTDTGAAPAATEPTGTLLGTESAGDAAPQDQQTENQPADKPAQGEAKTEDKPAEVDGAPEEYADFEAPEGVTLNPESLGKFKTLAKELNLSQDKAQKLATLGAEMMQTQSQRNTTALSEAAKTWEANARSDAEYGGDKFDDSMVAAKNALKQFATPELAKLLDETKLGNHPDVIRMFVKVGNAISEDRFVGGRAAPTGQPKPMAQRLYGKPK